MIPAPRTTRSTVRHRRPTAGLLVACPLVAGLLLAGCGSPAPSATDVPPASTTPTPSASATSTPEATPSATLAPAPSTSAESTSPVLLPWPASTAAETRTLQSEVDSGGQPWLLDPAEVARSYATAAHGWTEAETVPGPGGTAVEVRDGDHRLHLSLTQPGRSGDGGIWVVTAERRDS